MANPVNLLSPRKFEAKVLELFREGMTNVEDLAFELSIPELYRIPSNLRNGRDVVHDALVLAIQNAINTFDSRQTVIDIYTNKLIKPENNDCYLIYSEKSDEVLQSLKPETVREMLRGEKYKSLVKYGLYEGYSPVTRSRFYTDEGKHFFNTYVPPDWKLDYWYDRATIEPRDVPQMYMDFLNHLTDNRENDVNYILDWAAISLQSRNFTYLVTVGNSGIGKGVLGKIMERLHGFHNSVSLGASSIKKQFNKQMYGKTLIYFNEIFDISGEVSEKVKLLNEEFQEIEKKGIDSEVHRNYGNYYFSSNKYNSIKVDEQQRRFSFVDLTEKTYDYKGMNGEALLAPENIKELAHHLFTRKYNEYWLTKPYKSETSSFVMNSKMEIWQIYLSEEFSAKFKGEKILMKDLLSHLSNIPYRVKWDELSAYVKESKGLFSVKNESPKEATIFYDKQQLKITKDRSSADSVAKGTVVVQIK